jgi:hypothetical protein
MGKYSIGLNDQTRLLQIGKRKTPMIYVEAVELAARSAKSDSENLRLREVLRPEGADVGNAADATPLDQFTDEGDGKTTPEGSAEQPPRSP